MNGRTVRYVERNASPTLAVNAKNAMNTRFVLGATSRRTAVETKSLPRENGARINNCQNQ